MVEPTRPIPPPPMRVGKKRPAARRVIPAKPCVYVDRANELIPPEKWVALTATEDYCSVRSYTGENFRVQALWRGKVVNPQSSFPGQWKIFELTVENRVGELFEDNAWVIDPASTETFNKEADVIAAFEAIVERYSASYRDNTGSLVVVGDNSWIEQATRGAPAETVDDFGTW